MEIGIAKEVCIIIYIYYVHRYINDHMENKYIAICMHIIYLNSIILNVLRSHL